MRRIIICSGILGGGTALVFVLAALTATMFPHGTLVSNANPFWGGGPMIRAAVGEEGIGPNVFMVPAETKVFVDSVPVPEEP